MREIEKNVDVKLFSWWKWCIIARVYLLIHVTQTMKRDEETLQVLVTLS